MKNDEEKKATILFLLLLLAGASLALLFFKGVNYTQEAQNAINTLRQEVTTHPDDGDVVY